jgi:hypothetical protein
MGRIQFQFPMIVIAMTIKHLTISEYYVHASDKSLPVRYLQQVSFKYSLINPVSFTVLIRTSWKYSQILLF